MKPILSADTTVKLSGLKDFSLFLLKVLALYWTNLERVSADPHTPRRFSIFINRPYAIPNVKRIVDESPDTTPPF